MAAVDVLDERVDAFDQVFDFGELGRNVLVSIAQLVLLALNRIESLNDAVEMLLIGAGRAAAQGTKGGGEQRSHVSPHGRTGLTTRAHSSSSTSAWLKRAPALGILSFGAGAVWFVGWISQHAFESRELHHFSSNYVIRQFVERLAQLKV